MPEPSDPLRDRLASTPGLAALLAEAKATWLARAESCAQTDGAAAEADSGYVRGGDSTMAGHRPPQATAAGGTTMQAAAAAAVSAGVPASEGSDAVGARRATPRWRAFEDAFPTFYQFTNRPRS